MEEFLKGYFVQNKILILDNLGVLSLDSTPAYFDVQHQQLFPTYLNYSFSPDKEKKNNTFFFDNIAREFNISNDKAQQLYKNFVDTLISDFEKKLTFTIPSFITVRKVNNTYLVEIDSNLQLVLNPIAVEKNTSEINNIFTVENSLSVTPSTSKANSLPSTLPNTKKESPINPPIIKKKIESTITPPTNIQKSEVIKQTDSINEKLVQSMVVATTPNIPIPQKKEQSNSINKNQSLSPTLSKKIASPKPTPKKILVREENSDLKKQPWVIKLLLIITIVAIILIAIKFLLLNEKGYLTSWWR